MKNKINKLSKEQIASVKADKIKNIDQEITVHQASIHTIKKIEERSALTSAEKARVAELEKKIEELRELKRKSEASTK